MLCFWSLSVKTETSALSKAGMLVLCGGTNWKMWLETTNLGWATITLGRVKRIWYLSPMRAAKVQASLRIHAVLPEPPLLAHTSSESRGTFRQKVRSLAPLNGWACAVNICHDGMLEDTDSLDAAHPAIYQYWKWNLNHSSWPLSRPYIASKLSRMISD